MTPTTRDTNGSTGGGAGGGGVPTDVARWIDDVLAGVAARGRYSRADIDAAAPALALFVASVVPLGELAEPVRALVERTLDEAGALDADDERAFHAALQQWLAAHPIHPQLQADFKRALETTATGLKRPVRS